MKKNLDETGQVFSDVGVQKQNVEKKNKAIKKDNKSLEKEFNKHSKSSIAKSQKAYMRNQFEFHGLTANKRREIQNSFIKKNTITDLKKLTTSL